MQTKNINIEQAPLNNVPQKLALAALTSSPQQKNLIAAATAERNAPPLPPRAAIIFTPLPDTPRQEYPARTRDGPRRAEGVGVGPEVSGRMLVISPAPEQEVHRAGLKNLETFAYIDHIVDR